MPTREDGVENRDKVYSQRKNERLCPRLQNSPHFCVFKYARAVKQKVWNEAENRERYGHVRLARFARKPLTPRFTDFFTDFERKTDFFAV